MDIECCQTVVGLFRHEKKPRDEMGTRFRMNFWIGYFFVIILLTFFTRVPMIDSGWNIQGLLS